MSKEDTGASSASSAEPNPTETDISVGRGPRLSKQQKIPSIHRSGSGRGGGAGSNGGSSRGDGGSGGSGSSGTAGGSGLGSESRSSVSPHANSSYDYATQTKDQQAKLLNDPRFRIRPLQQVVSACTGAMITACFMTPLDVIKTRMQSQQSPSHKCFFYSNGLMDHLFPCGSSGDGQPAMVSQRPRPQFTSSWDALVKISRYEGIASLWSGLGPTLVSALPSTIIYFVAYEQFKANYKKIYERHFKSRTQPRKLALR